MLLLCLSGCSVDREITRYEGDEVPPAGGNAMYAYGITYERMIEYAEHYHSLDSRFVGMYLPTEGEFTAEDGEKFTAKVGASSLIIASNLSRSSAAFHLRIYSPDGELIIEEDISSKADSVTVSAEMEKYWNAVKKLPSELFGNDETEVEA